MLLHRKHVSANIAKKKKKCTEPWHARLSPHSHVNKGAMWDNSRSEGEKKAYSWCAAKADRALLSRAEVIDTDTLECEFWF